MTDPSSPFANPPVAAAGFGGQTVGYGAPSYGQGPPGTPRNIGTAILLAVVTLGIYTFVWTWKTHDEVKRNTGVGVGGPLGFLIYFFVSPVTFFLLPSEVGQMIGRSGRQSKVQGLTGLWIVLPFVGSLVWFVKVQGQLNEYWRSLGATG